MQGKPRSCLDFVALEYYGPQKFWETKTFVKLNLKLAVDIKRFNSQISLHQIILYPHILGFQRQLGLGKGFLSLSNLRCLM